jgi:hypothetical protein
MKRRTKPGTRGPSEQDTKELAEASRGVAVAKQEIVVEARRVVVKLDLNDRDITSNLSIPEIVSVARAAKKKGPVGRPTMVVDPELWIEKLAQRIHNRQPYESLSEEHRPDLAADHKKAFKALRDFRYLNRREIKERIAELKKQAGHC